MQAFPGDSAGFAGPSGGARRRGNGFTLTELLLVVAIVSVLAAILLPVYAAAREKARATACLGHMRQIGQGLYQYLGDWDDTYPFNRFPWPGADDFDEGHFYGTRYTWRRALARYLKSYDVWRCPSNGWAYEQIGGAVDTGPWGGDESNAHPPFAREGIIPNSYAYNGSFFDSSSAGLPARPRELSEIRDPAGLICILESRSTCPELADDVLDWREIAPGRGWFQTHRKGLNWIFADTHARWLPMALTIKPRQMWRRSGNERADQLRMEAHLWSMSREYR